MKIFFSTLTVLSILFSDFLNSQTIFQYAAEGNIVGIKTLLEEDPSLLDSKDNNGKTALSFASEKGYFEIVKLLIEKGANVNTQNNFGTTPLHYASFYNYPDIVRLLIDNYAQLNLHSDFTPTPLGFAASRGNTDIVRILIENGADVNIPDRQNKSPLHFAAEAGHIGSAILLLDAGADLNAVTQTGENICHGACKSGNCEIISRFLEKKVSFDKVDKYGKTPLFYAVERGSAEAVELILKETNPDFGTKSNDGNTLLHAAAEGGLKDFALLCIKHGIEINDKNIFGFTPLDIAERKDNLEMTDFLKQYGAKPKSSRKLIGDYVDNNEPGLTPVLFAPGIISTPDFNERDVTFTPDGNEIYFTRWPMNRVWNILTMKKQDDGWCDPVKASISSDYRDAEAFVTYDGNKIFFISNRPKTGEGTAENWEMWFSNRVNGDWSKPNLLGDKFKGGFYPTFTKNGTMYFTDVENDISKSYLSDDGYKGIINLGDSVNTTQAEYNSLIAPDESYLIFTSTGWGKGYGNDDLYICFRKEDGTWTKAKNMGPIINSFAREYCPAISYDGKYLFFCSSRYGTEDIFWIDAKIIRQLK